MGRMHELGLLDCEDRPSIEENFARIKESCDGPVLDENGKLLNEVLPEGYPYEEEGLVEAVAEHSVEVTVGDKNGTMAGINMNDPALGAIFNLVNHDEDIVVIYDGVEYECKVLKGENELLFGNLGLYGDVKVDYDPTIPFCAMAVDYSGNTGGGLITIEAEGSESGSTVTHTLACFKTAIIPEPIDTKFLPAVVITSNASGKTINCAYGDFWSYIQKGVPVIYDDVTNSSRYYAHSFVQENGWIRIVTPSVTFAFSEDGTIDVHLE